MASEARNAEEQSKRSVYEASSRAYMWKDMFVDPRSWSEDECPQLTPLVCRIRVTPNKIPEDPL